MAALIEGLPDAVVLICLARVPLSLHPTLQAVCKSWRALVRSSELFQARKLLGTAEDWLYVCTYEPDKIWKAYDPVCNRWSVLPRLPSRLPLLSNFGTAALDGKLYVLGGTSDYVDCVTGDFVTFAATNEVWAYDPVHRVWTLVAPMITARSQFACFSWAGQIVVAGGFTGARRSTGNAERYDPAENKWHSLADLVAVPMTACSGVLLEGKMYVVHKRERMAQVYEEATKKWLQVEDSWSEGPSAIVNEELYVVRHGVVSREHRLPTLRRSLCSWPQCLRRIGFGVAGLGGDLYVVGGILRPGPDVVEEYLDDVDIGTVGREDIVWRKGASLPLSRGTVLGCKVLRL